MAYTNKIIQPTVRTHLKTQLNCMFVVRHLKNVWLALISNDRVCVCVCVYHYKEEKTNANKLYL